MKKKKKGKVKSKRKKPTRAHLKANKRRALEEKNRIKNELIKLYKEKEKEQHAPGSPNASG